jgi:hypothetical protein
MQEAEDTSEATGQAGAKSSNPTLNDFKKNAFRIFLVITQYLNYNSLLFVE